MERLLIFICILQLNSSKHYAQNATELNTNRSQNADTTKQFLPLKDYQEFVPQINNECKDEFVCEDVSNYPDDYVDNVLKMYKHECKLNEEPKTFENSVAIKVELCSLRIKYLVPLAMRSRQGEWYFVINNKRCPFQNYKVEICVNRDFRCSNIVSLEEGWEPRCLQKFTTRELLALDHRGQTQLMAATLPSCCVCVATT